MAPEKLSAEVKKLNTIKEGSASILVPEGPQDVFYNPIQQFNRDLSVLAIRAFGEDRIARVASKPPGRNHRQKRPKNGRDHRSLNTVKSGPEGQGQINDEPPTKRQKVDSEDKAVTQEQDPPEVDQPEKPQDGSNESNRGHRRQYPISILDALSATGLRALRYAKELPFDTVVTANDMSKDATASIKQNIKHNGLEDRIAISTANAQAYMYTLAGNDDGTKYDVVDLDPYGTAVPFLDAAVQALKSGGLLCVTCTDAGIFASCGYPEKTYSLYGGLPIKGLHSHEGGLRLILHAISSSASRYGIAVEPLLSLSIDFYARLFVRVKQSPADVKFLAGRTMVVYNCDAGCGAWSTQYLARNSIYSNKNPNNIVWKHSFAQAPTSPPLCPHCGFKTHLSGPMFGGPLHNHAFIHRILDYLPSLDKSIYQTTDRLEGMLITALEECDSLHDLTTTNPSSPNKPSHAHPSNKPATAPPPPPAPSSSSAPTSSSNPTPPTTTTTSSPLIPPLHPSTLDPHPFPLFPSALAKVLHCAAPSLAHLRGALRGLGHRCWRSHTKPGSLRTDASWDTVWRVMRAWVAQEARVRRRAVREGTAGCGILKRGRELGEGGGWFVDEGGEEGENGKEKEKEKEERKEECKEAGEKKEKEKGKETGERGDGEEGEADGQEEEAEG
ncbi:N2,N2-dimethylguanosine tRNA methyltransferase, partial [Viridothelium virens]